MSEEIGRDEKEGIRARMFVGWKGGVNKKHKYELFYHIFAVHCLIFYTLVTLQLLLLCCVQFRLTQSTSVTNGESLPP